MTAEINDLFEEGITRCRELTDAADEAMNAIDEVAKVAEELTRRAEDEGGEACQHMRDLASRLEQAEGELETTGGQAEAALEGLAGKAADLRTEVGELLDRVKRSLDEIESRQDQLHGSLDAQMTSAEQGFQELAQKTRDAQERAQQQLQEAAEAIATFSAAVDAARGAFLPKLQAWAAAAQSLETTAHEQADAWVDALNDLLARQTAAMQQAAQGMLDKHNVAMGALKHRFVEMAPLELGTALEPVRSALERLGEDAAVREQSLATEAKELEQWAMQALPLIEAVQGVLTSTAQLE